MSLEAQIRYRLGPIPQARDWPLVSIVVLNRDGAELLRRLFGGLSRCTDYPRIELILVDNGSSDDSLDLVRTVDVPFPISIVSNPLNESFSDACNRGAELASGGMLLFLNNDIEPFEPGWLCELVASLRRLEGAAVASTLVCLDEEHEKSFRYGYGVQHRGLTFAEEGGMIHPVLRGWEADPLDEELGEDRRGDALAAACLLVDRDAFTRVGGFSHGYVYGGEDVDFSLKLRTAGLGVFCSGRSIVIHHPVSTRRRALHEEERVRKIANRRLLWERWGPRLRREYEFGRLRDDGSRAGAEALGFCIHQAIPDAAEGIGDVVAALRRAGRRCILLQEDRAEDAVGLNYDVAVYVSGTRRYVPKPGQLNVLLPAGSLPSPLERSRYDLMLGETADPGSQNNAASRAAMLISSAEAAAAETGFNTRVGLAPRRDGEAVYVVNGSQKL